MSLVAINMVCCISKIISKICSSHLTASYLGYPQNWGVYPAHRVHRHQRRAHGLVPRDGNYEKNGSSQWYALQEAWDSRILPFVRWSGGHRLRMRGWHEQEGLPYHCLPWPLLGSCPWWHHLPHHGRDDGKSHWLSLWQRWLHALLLQGEQLLWRQWNCRSSATRWNWTRFRLEIQKREELHYRHVRWWCCQPGSVRWGC